MCPSDPSAVGLSSAGQSRLAGDFESEVFDHSVVLRGGLALGREVIPDEDAIGDHQAQGLERSEVAFATAGDPQFACGVDEAEHGQGSDAVAGREVFLLLHRSAIDGMEEIQGDRLDGELLERESHFDDVLSAFTHSDDPTAAECQSRFSDIFKRLDAVLEGVGRADLRVVFLAGIEVMVDFVDPCGGQPLGLRFVEQSEASADIQTVGLLDFRDDLFDRLDLTFVRCPAADDNAVGFALPLGGKFGPLEQLIAAEDVVFGDRSVGNFRLATVVAILGAKSTFGVHQEIKLNGLAEVSLADFECRVDQIQKLLVARVEDG